MLRFFILICLFAGLSTVSWAQQPQRTRPAPRREMKPGSTTTTTADTLTRSRVGALARAYGDSIAVRWAPDNALLFRAATRAGGYRVTRLSQTREQGIRRDYTRIIAPEPVDGWKRTFSPRDTLAGACAQLLWGKNEPLRQDASLDQILRQQQQADLRLMLGLTLADVNPRHARAMGLGLLDTDVKRGVTYIYTIAPLSDQAYYPADSGLVAVVNSGSAPAPAMLPVSVQAGDRVAQLLWNRTAADRAFTAYYVDRSDDGGRTFHRLTRRPWTQPIDKTTRQDITYRDSLARNYQPYQYRITGITPFGERSLPTLVTVSGIDRTAPAAVTQLKAEHLGGARVRLTWQHPNPPGDLSGYLIGKATAIDGQYVPLNTRPLPTSQRTFTDTTAIPYLQAYYVVIALDTARNAGPSSPAYCMFRDRTGPAKPKGLKGYIDSTGFVRIVWDRNREPDLLGYKVLMANDPTHVFLPVTKTYQSVAFFDDTTSLKTLTKHLYYRVVAYDRSYNPSPASELLTLTRPDKVKPAPPAIRTYVASDTAIQLTWVPSASEDVAGQVLLRRGAPTERWTELKRIPATQTTYTDATVKPDAGYQYAVVAVDSAGLQSAESFPLTVRTIRATPRPIQQLSVRLGADRKSVLLNWKLPNEFARYIIYRSVSGKPLQTYGAVNRELTFTDKTVSPGQYDYAVRVIYQDGRESGLSNRVTINVN